MPLYEYECNACGHRFEQIQKFSDPPPDSCPACHGSVRKLASTPAIQFKGSGWYITDYARKGKDSGGSAEAESESTTAKSEGTAAKSDGATAKSDGTTPREKSAPASESKSSSSSGPAVSPGSSSTDS
jgi:putative FmdB family regulatory protein